MRKEKKAWQNSEDDAAKIYGRKTAGSGSGNDKLDIVGEGEFSGFRIENKHTDANSFSISLTVINKAKSQAIAMGCNAYILRIDLHGKKGIWIEETDFLSHFTRRTDN